MMDKTLLLSLRWSVCYVLRRSTKNGNKTPDSNKQAPTQKHMQHSSAQRERAEGKIVVYREYFLKLLATPKSLRDQLIIELPCLEGFRTGEVSTVRAEWFDVPNGDLQVLDSKNGKMYTLPLDSTVAKCFLQMNVTEGPLITGRKHTGKGLSSCHIERIWSDCCWNANIPVMHPRLGRAYLATFEHFVLGKPTAYIQWELRHDSLQSTEHYLSRIVDYKDMKAMFYVGKGRMFPEATINTEIKQP